MKAQLQPKFGRKNGVAMPVDAGIEALADPAADLGNGEHSSAPLADELPAPPPITLDLVPALPARDHGEGQIVLKIEGMAPGASLSAGRNNGNNTWSLAPDQIADLEYTLAHGPLFPHTLQVRVLSVAEDQATTLILLETDIGTDGEAAPLRLFAERPDATGRGAANGDDIETTAGLSRAITQSRHLARTRIAAAKAASEADNAGGGAAESGELAELRNRIREIEDRLAAREQALADATAVRARPNGRPASRKLVPKQRARHATRLPGKPRPANRKPPQHGSARRNCCLPKRRCRSKPPAKAIGRKRSAPRPKRLSTRNARSCLPRPSAVAPKPPGPSGPLPR